jgi:ATP/ADP translocase
MKDRIFRILGVEVEEESMVSMLLTQSVFLGIFFGAFDISAHSIFLAVFDEKAMARAYVISGLAGIILTGIYTWFQARLRFKTFATINLVFITFATLLLWIALLLFPGKVITFAVFVLLGPLNILAMLGFWGTVGRLFSLRQGKRLFGLVDSGLIVGIIISCYAIPVLLSLRFSSHNILLVSAASVMVAAAVQVLIGRKFSFVVTAEATEAKKTGLSIFRTNSYIRVMGLFIALSVMTAFFVQYSFMAVTRLQYPLEEDMARFLGLFTGSMMIFTLLIKLLVFSYIIRNYGLKLCLAVSPILVAGFTALAIIIGMTMGYTPASISGFVIFFLILALSRLFSKSLKDSIESPSFKVIYQTVDEKIRYEVQSGIDGTINEIAALSSGLLLAGLGAISFIKLIHFSWVLFAIIAAWIILAFRLYAEYRGAIRKSLESAEKADAAIVENWENLKSSISGNLLFRDSYYSLAAGDLGTVEKANNRWFFRKLIEFAETRQDLSLAPSLLKISGRTDIDETLRHRALEVIDQLEKSKGDPRLLHDLEGFQIDDERVINARRTLSSSRMPQTTEILRLLRDNNIESRRYGLFMIGKFRMHDMIHEVCDCLGVPGLEADSVSVLRSFGSQAYDHLVRAYLGASGNINISKSIINLLAEPCGKENTEFLFARLWSHSRRIKEMAAVKLIKCGFSPGEDDRDRLNQLASELIGMITWNIAARATLEKTENKVLAEVIRNETAAWNNFLFNILSIAYDQSSIEKIKDNIEIGTVGSINYALEMIDIVIDESLKPRLIALIDAVPDEEKVKNLSQFYTAEIMGEEQLVEDILNRDYNLIGIWAKACALRTTEKIKDKTLQDSVVALLFSPVEILREEAAKLISRSDIGIFKAAGDRIPSSDYPLLEEIVSGKMDEMCFIFEKTRSLAGLFPSIPEDDLLFSAGSVKWPKGELKQEHLGGEEHLLWNVRPSGDRPGSLYISRGEPEELKIISAADYGEGFYMLPVKALNEFRNYYPERSFEFFSRIDITERSLIPSV